MKICNSCKQKQPVENFYAEKRLASGRIGIWKSCIRKRDKERAIRLKNTKCKYCDRPVKVLKTGLCVPHQARLLKGDLQLDKPIRSPGSTFINPNGYRVLYKPDHPNAYSGGSILEHTFVMSEYLGRPLLPGENVHHKNGDRADNRLENLELWSRAQPPGQRVEDKIEWAIELLKLYKPDILSA